MKEAIPTATMHKHMEVRRAWEPEEVVELVKRVKLFGNPYILMRASNLPLQEMWIDVSDSLAQARIHRVPESCKGKWKVTRQLFFKLLLSTAPVPPRYQDWFGMVMEMWEAAGRPKFGERTYFSTLNKGYTRRSRGSSSNPGVSSQKILKIEARNEDLPETENHERILDYSIQTACCSLKERSGIRSSDLVKVRNGPGTFTPVTRSYSGSDDEAVENESIEEQKAEAGEEPPHLEPESTEKSRSCTPSGKKKSSRLIKEEEPTSSPTNLQPPKKARIQLHHEFSSLYHVPQQPPILPLLGDNGSALSTTDLMRRQVIQLQRLNRHQEELTQLMKDIATHMKTIVTEVGTVASSMAEMKQELKCELVHLRQAFEKTNSTQDSSPQDSPASSKSAAGPSTLQLTPVQSSGFSSSICTLSVAPCTPPALNPQFQVTKK